MTCIFFSRDELGGSVIISYFVYPSITAIWNGATPTLQFFLQNIFGDVWRIVPFFLLLLFRLKEKERDIFLYRIIFMLLHLSN